jgi:hypothetical protein
MSKTVILVSATIFSIVGGFVPYLWGDDNPLGGWSLVFGGIGGLFGIWLAVWISKRYG